MKTVLAINCRNCGKAFDVEVYPNDGYLSIDSDQGRLVYDLLSDGSTLIDFYCMNCAPDHCVD